MKVELGYKWEAFSESVTDLCLLICCSDG